MNFFGHSVLAREERDIHAGGVWGEIARHRREGLRAYVPRAPCEVRLEVEDVLERVPLLVVDLRVQTEQKRSTRAGGQRTEVPCPGRLRRRGQGRRTQLGADLKPA